MEETAEAWAAAGPSVHGAKAGLVGVYAGCMYNEYLRVIAAASTNIPPQVQIFGVCTCPN